MATKASSVRSMFAGIAPRYDLLNHLLSLNLDRGWRRRAVEAVAPRPGELVLDACAGTFDLALGLARTGARVVAMDFCREMLVLGEAKARRARLAVPAVEGDALQPPFASHSFDAITVAFGVRNLEDPARGLRLLAGLLRPGGRLAVLDFARPRHALFRSLYYAYFHRLLPRIGGVVSGRAEAYRYLPDSVMTFLTPEELAEVLRAAGLSGVRATPLALGAVALVTGHRPADPAA